MLHAVIAAWFGTALAAPPHVLVRLDAPLLQEPDAEQPKARPTKPFDHEAHPERVGYAALLGRGEGWVQLQATSYQLACHRPLAIGAPAGLILWTRTDHLVPVVQRPITFEDGPARVVVHPGVAVRENVDATYTLAVKGLQVTAAFPQDAIGPRFQPEPAPRSGFRPTHGATGEYGTDGLKIALDQAPVIAAEGEDRWTAERRCLQATGPRRAGNTPVPGGASSDGHGGSARRIKKAWPLAEGTVLRWPDGVYAGTLVHPYRLPDTGAEAPAGLVCGQVPPGLVVCAPDPEDPAKAPPLRYVALSPTVRQRTEPKHPKGEVKGRSARCRVQVDFGPKGAVQQVQVRACAEPFQEAVERAVRTWTYAPHTVDGRAVPARTWTWIAFEG